MLKKSKGGAKVGRKIKNDQVFVPKTNIDHFSGKGKVDDDSDESFNKGPFNNTIWKQLGLPKPNKRERKPNWRDRKNLDRERKKMGLPKKRKNKKNKDPMDTSSDDEVIMKKPEEIERLMKGGKKVKFTLPDKTIKDDGDLQPLRKRWEESTIGLSE